MLLAFLPFVLTRFGGPPEARETLVNRGWEFRLKDGGSGWKSVNLPHSPVLMGPDFASFQGVVEYRKEFDPKSSYSGKRVVLRFDGAMQVATCSVNGSPRLTHEGGYLPFDLDLSSELSSGKKATVDVVLDNRDNSNFNPGRSQNGLDFTYAGGLYRDVWLEVTPKSHLSDVYATTASLEHDSARVMVQAETEGVAPGSRISVRVLNAGGHVAAEGTQQVQSARVTAYIDLAHPKLWDLDHPNLYTVEVSLVSGGRLVDRTSRRIGIRKVEFDHSRGFSLNGKPMHLQGTNRHMAFPVVGNAASDAAQYREAKLLKDGGMQILRLAHYPQSPAFLDACDALGILVIDPIPGWQFFKDTPHFREHVLSDVREMVRRDRNHPSVAIFETCLNETYNVPDDFWRECSRTAHEEFGVGNFYTGGDAYGKQDYSKPIWDVPWTGWDDDTFTRPALFKMQKGIDREYGDYEFGGEESTSRADWQDGEPALMLQEWNFIWSHNRNRGNPWSFCDLTWEGIDTVRGLSPDHRVSKSGLFDLYRRPKPVVDFYRSQVAEKPFVSISNEWTDRPSPTKVVVFSNCDEVELFLNGKSLGRRKSDSGPTTGYIGPKTADPLYWAHGKGDIVPASELTEPVGGTPGALPFSGGNCRNLEHPPFTFDSVAYKPGRLVAVGYIAGREVSRSLKGTPGAAVQLRVRCGLEGVPLKADGADFVFVYVDVLDANGQLVLGAHDRVNLNVAGCGEGIGPLGAVPSGGVAEFMVRSSGVAGTVHLRAVSMGHIRLERLADLVARQ